MGIFDKVSETFSNTGREVSNKAKSVADIARLRLLVFTEEEKLKDCYTELGRRYYKANSAEAVEEYASIFDEICAIKADIERDRQQIYAMRGVKVCEKCGTEVDAGYIYCGFCGAKLPKAVETPQTVDATCAVEDVEEAEDSFHDIDDQDSTEE